MDNLTHSLVGMVLSRAGLNRVAPQAGWVLLAAANLPDIDIVSGLVGPATYLRIHRGWTHSLLGAPFLALLPLLLWRLLVRKPLARQGRWLATFTVSLIGVLSHLLLDWLNVYGVRLLTPFSGDWLRLDLVYIIDIWLWAILIVGVAAPMLARLVSGEIGAQSGSGRGAAWLALGLAGAYLMLRVTLHAQATTTLDARLHQGRPAIRVAAFPTPINPMEWVGLAETADFYRVYPMNMSGDFDPDRGRTLYKTASSAVPDAVRQTATVQVMNDFAQFPLWRVAPTSGPDGGTMVTLTDLRFGLPEDDRFEAIVKLNPLSKVVAETFRFGNLDTGRR
jgi:inner membrane protein